MHLNLGGLMSLLAKILAITLITIGSASCVTTEVVEVPVPLSRPERPVLPPIKSADVHAQSAECWIGFEPIWNTMVRRELLRKQYAERLEVIIDSANGGIAP